MKVDIDFDEASKQWKKNKIYLGNGNYKYRCVCNTQKGLDCKNRPIIHNNRCYIHSNMK